MIQHNKIQNLHSRQIRKGYNSKAGSTISVALITIIVLSILLVSVSRIVTHTIRTTERQNLDLITRLLAEEGVEDAFWRIKDGQLIPSSNEWTLDSSGTNQNGIGTFEKYTRTYTTNSNNRNGTIIQEIVKTTQTFAGEVTHLYDVNVSSSLIGSHNLSQNDGFRVTVENLGSITDFAGIRMMNNARDWWQIDQAGSYDSNLDQITGEMLYSYDNAFTDASGNSYPRHSLQGNAGFNTLGSYEPVEIFIGEWGHSKIGSELPYISYYSRDLAADNGQSEPVNVYYARRIDVEEHPNTTLTAGDNKDFFDFITGANEADATAAAQSFPGVSDVDDLTTVALQKAFSEELVTNTSYQPDPSQYNFIEIAGSAPEKLPFDGTYSGSSFVAGTINKRRGNYSVNTNGSDSVPAGADGLSISVSGNDLVIRGGSIANKEAAIINLNFGWTGNVIIDAGSNVILTFADRLSTFRSNSVQVLDGGSLTVHLPPTLDSFEARSAALALSGDPLDLTILDQPSESEIFEAGVGTGEYQYDGTDMALGDPYREYQPYKALNLDNANHPTVATIYAPYSTVYTDHFAGVVVSEHYQTHGVMMLDRYAFKNSPYLASMIVKADRRFEVRDLLRK